MLNDGNALAILPNTLRFGVDPSKFGEGVREALQPFGTGFFVVVFHAAAALQNFVGAHGGVAYKNQFVVFVVLAQDVPCWKLLCIAALVVFPHEVVNTVVEVIELQVLELGLGSREQFFNARNVVVHGAAHIHQQQHLHVVVALRHHLDVEVTRIGGSGANGVGQI